MAMENNTRSYEESDFTKPNEGKGDHTPFADSDYSTLYKAFRALGMDNGIAEATRWVHQHLTSEDTLLGQTVDNAIAGVNPMGTAAATIINGINKVADKSPDVKRIVEETIPAVQYIAGIVNPVS